MKRFINFQERKVRLVNELEEFAPCRMEHMGNERWFHGGGSSGTTTQKSEPWGPSQPYLKDIYAQAGNLFNNYSSEYAPGGTVAEQSPIMQAAMQGYLDYGTGDFAANATSQGQQALNTLGGVAGGGTQTGAVGRALAPVAGQSLVDVMTGGSQAYAPSFDRLNIDDLGGIPGVSAGGGTPNVMDFFKDLDPFNANEALPNVAPIDLYTQQVADWEMGLNPGDNPFFRGVIDNYLGESNRNFEENTLNMLELSNIGNNAYGSTRQGIAEGVAARGLNQTQDSYIAQLLAEQYNRDLARRNQAAVSADEAGLTQRGQDVSLAGQRGDLALGARGQDVNYASTIGTTGANLANSSLDRMLEASKANASNALGMRGQNIGAFVDQRGQDITSLANFMNAQNTASNNALGALSEGEQMQIDAAKAAGLLAPSIQQMPLTSLGAVEKAGAYDQSYLDALKADEVAAHNFYQNLPYDQLNQYAGVLSGAGNQGGTRTTETPGVSRAAGILGGGLAGAGAAGSLGLAASNPWTLGLVGIGAMTGLL